MYAIVTTGGKQYRVERGQSLLVERLPVDDGGDATLRPLLYVDGDNLVDGEDLAKVTVQARVVGHERGPKLRVVKFKPKRGYKRRTGHRQELTRIEVTEIKLASRRPSSRSAPKPVAAEEREGAESAASGAAAPAAASRRSTKGGAGESQAKPTRRKAPAQVEGDEANAKPKPTRARRKPTATEPEEEGNGA